MKHQEIALETGEPSEEHQKFEYVIENMAPIGRASLLVGPSGSSKTTLALQWIESWLNGEQILDKPVRRPLVHIETECSERACHDKTHYAPGTVLYLAADRGKGDTEETLDRVLGPNNPLLTNPDSGFEWDSMLDSVLNINHLYERIRPHHKVVFIEGVASLIDGGRINDHGIVSNFLKRASDAAGIHNVAMILSVHSPKMKLGEEYRDPRNRILGSVAWGHIPQRSLCLHRMLRIKSTIPTAR